MIRHSSITPEPKHKATQHGLGLASALEVRDYPIHVCPGQHCAGRAHLIEHGHRHTDYPVHTLTPAQVDAATTYSGRVR